MIHSFDKCLQEEEICLSEKLAEYGVVISHVKHHFEENRFYRLALIRHMRYLLQSLESASVTDVTSTTKE